MPNAVIWACRLALGVKVSVNVTLQHKMSLNVPKTNFDHLVDLEKPFAPFLKVETVFH